jgi:hypothetical protein
MHTCAMWAKFRVTGANLTVHIVTTRLYKRCFHPVITLARHSAAGLLNRNKLLEF